MRWMFSCVGRTAYAVHCELSHVRPITATAKCLDPHREFPDGETRVTPSALQELRSVDELAQLLGLTRRFLDFLAYGEGASYHTILIKKRRGGVRTISQPHDKLKRTQREILKHLSALYRPRACVQGFVEGRSIATNAAIHAGRRWVLNLDLRDFFPSVHFGRVRGMLASSPYRIDMTVATVIAQLCTDDESLPQGAPTSPILSNMVCGRLDSELMRLARRYDCAYTRYADDITFSTDRVVFPPALGTRDLSSKPPTTLLGPIMTNTVEGNDFGIASEKVRLQKYDEHQEVTGLTVNEFPNVRRSFRARIRAMLHAWEKFGLDAAEKAYFASHDSKHRGPHSNATFRSVLKGHIDFLGMIRGVDHPWYEKFASRLASLDEEYRVRPRSRRRRNHLLSELDAIWVLESDELIEDTACVGQGSAFELEGWGLLTCAHCVLRESETGEMVPVQDLRAYQPHTHLPEQPVRVARYDVVRDLAVLEIEKPSGYLLRPRRRRGARGEQVRARGYPGQAEGVLDWQDHGVITQVHHHVGSPRLLVSCPIVSGASGSPVFDVNDRVIGVASLGAESFEGAATKKMVRYGVIPIDLLGEMD